MAALKFSEISGRLPADARRRCLELAGKAPRKARAKARPAEISAPPRAAAATDQVGWTLRTCADCGSEMYGPPGLACPIECWEWMGRQA